MKYLYDLKDKLCNELMEIAEKQDMSAGDLEAVHKLTDTIKNIDKIAMLEADEGYSKHGGDWEARGNYGGGMYRDDRYGQRMRGRYSRHDGTDKKLMDELEDLMHTIEPGKRDVIRRALEELKEM